MGWTLIILSICILCYIQFFRWWDSKSRLDYSAWMVCHTCKVKWRPTAYGPVTPDDWYCLHCGENTNVKVLTDKYHKRACKDYRKI